MIARTRLVAAHGLFAGQADLNGYPFQVLGVYSQKAGPARRT